MSRCGAKRPSGDSSSTCRWAPQGMDWALQAGILSIQPLQAAWETGDGATDSLYLLDYCWESVLGGTAGLTGISANKFCIFASSLPAQRLPESFFHCLFPIYCPSSGLALSLTDLFITFTPLFRSPLIHSPAFDGTKVRLHLQRAARSCNYT